MSCLKNNPICLKMLFSILLVHFTVFGFTRNAATQVTRKYLSGENNTVEMIVHIIGQVQKPGKYRVQDKTNLIELLAEAGGHTEFSNLSNVTISHINSDSLDDGKNRINQKKYPRIIKYDINKYLKEENALSPPILKPGDVVMVPKNKWSAWRNLASIIRDVSVVASAYFLYLRVAKD